jgi:hypothetical protein
MENDMAPATAAVLSITEERQFTARLGERTVTGLALASTWEGFTKYTNRDGALIVLDADQHIIKASPELIDQLGLAQPSTDFVLRTAIGAMKIGDVLGGGYFAGVIDVYGRPHALVVAGNDGELRDIWSDDSAPVDGAVSRFDGKANTFAMSRAGSKLAQAAQAIAIGGHDDWYIPSRDELDLLYRAFKPTEQRNYADGTDGENQFAVPAVKPYTKDFPVQTTVTSFRNGGANAFGAAWYWSSTQHASFPSNAWGQGFSGGYHVYGHKGNQGRVRVVRRLPI